MRLVHTSDIHFGGYGRGWDPNKDQRRELLCDLVRLVEEGGPVDGVVVGGDIAYHGHKAEYQEAANWLGEVCERGGCLPGRVWVVPGNHDIDRDLHAATHSRASLLEAVRTAIQDAKPGGIDRVLSDWFLKDPGAESHLACLAAYNDFARQYACPTTAASPSWTDPTLDLDGLDVQLTGLNTVLASDTNDYASKPSLVLGRAQCELPRSNGRLHIAFMHHPPTWLADWERVEPYLLRAHLLLFGHEHKYKAEQPIDGGTVFVYAGAVGPHEGEGDDYVPSWNLITLKRADDQVHITIEPRVWCANGTCFGTHPDGTTTKTVPVDLQGRFVGQAHNQEVEVVEADNEAVNAPVTSANPLVSDLGDAPGGADLPAASDRSRLRELTVAFLKLTRSQRNQLAAQLGLDSGLADVDPHEVNNEILRRVREANKINDLAEKLNHA
jgi:DNA repair exonuclease SbcCD nuclease subunit